MAKKFNLGDYLKTDGASELNTEQIVKIDLDRIDPDPNNFYSLEGIDELAANIELVGLLDALRVRPQGERFVIVSGHRRRAACMLIRDGGNPMFDNGLPCIIELGEAGETMRELRMIFANSSTRVMSSAEISKQAERVTELLYQLKEQGVDFPGRMREHVAQACQVSESKLARLHAIRKNLIDVYRLSFDAGKLTESNAYLLSRESQTTQRGVFTRIGPTASGLTVNELEAVIASARNRKATTEEPQTVSPVRSSFDAEAYLEERAREDHNFFEMLSAEADTFINNMGAVNSRQEGTQLLKENLGRYHHGWYNGKFDVTCNPKGVRLWDVNHKRGGEDITRTWTDVYDMLCTIALNRAAVNIGAETEDVSRMDASEPAWQIGKPAEPGWYCCWAQWVDKYKGALPSYDPDYETLFWNGTIWTNGLNSTKDAGFTVHGWVRLPDPPDREG